MSVWNYAFASAVGVVVGIGAMYLKDKFKSNPIKDNDKNDIKTIPKIESRLSRDSFKAKEDELARPPFPKAAEGSGPPCSGINNRCVASITFPNEQNVIKYNNDDLLEQIIKIKWEKQTENCISMCQICDVCGGSSISTCHCAYKIFKTEEQKNILAEIDKEWEASPLGAQLICSNGSPFQYEFRREQFKNEKLKEIFDNLNKQI